MKEAIFIQSRKPSRSVIFAVVIIALCRSVDGYSQYTNSWAVEVRGGRRVADKLAKEHGFTNMGEVSRLDMHGSIHIKEGRGNICRAANVSLANVFVTIYS